MFMFIQAVLNVLHKGPSGSRDLGGDIEHETVKKLSPGGREKDSGQVVQRNGKFVWESVKKPSTECVIKCIDAQMDFADTSTECVVGASLRDGKKEDK